MWMIFGRFQVSSEKPKSIVFFAGKTKDRMFTRKRLFVAVFKIKFCRKKQANLRITN